MSLLAIGILVVLAVYGYSAWQQRTYRRRFGAAFKMHHGDALYHGTAPEAAAMPDAPNGKPGTLGPSSAQPSAGGDEACAILDATTDYIAVLSLNSPMNASVLGSFWACRFDFGKNVNVCGLAAATGKWERIVAESQLACTSFRLALQLADRNGAISVGRLCDFRDLVRQIGGQVDADVSLPDAEQAAQSAQQLDVFCAEVDQMIGLNILPGGDRQLAGGDVARVAGQHGLTLQADGAFHLLDERGHTLFSLANYDNIPFQHHTLAQMRVSGLSLQLDVPRVPQPMQRFDDMSRLAKKIADGLRATVVDDHRIALSDGGLALIRAQVAAIEDTMGSWPLVPGSPQARRLFA